MLRETRSPSQSRAEQRASLPLRSNCPPPGLRVELSTRESSATLEWVPSASVGGFPVRWRLWKRAGLVAITRGATLNTPA